MHIHIISFFISFSFSRFFCPLLLYGSGVKTEEGGKQLALSRVLPLLRRMAQYQRYCQKVLSNTIRQVWLFCVGICAKLNTLV